MVVLPPTGRVQGVVLDSNGTGGSNIFSNAGTFTKQGSGLARFGNSGNVTFNNTGAVDIQAGTLSLSSGTGTGAFSIASGACFPPADISSIRTRRSAAWNDEFLR